MRSPSPVILHDESRDLPFRACAALAHRAVSRAFEILPYADPSPLPDGAQAIVTEVLGHLEQIAAGTTGRSALHLHHNHKPLLLDIDRILKDLPGGTPRRSAWLCLQSATTLGGFETSGTIACCRSMTWLIEPTAHRKKAERLVESATFADFKQVRLAFEAATIGPDIPVPVETLGPLWPTGPVDWGRFIWADIEAERAREGQESEDATLLLVNLSQRSNTLPMEIRNALDRTAGSRGEGWRHAFFMEGDKPSKKWPAALRKPASTFTEQLHAFYRVHAWGGLFIPPGELEGAVWIIAPESMHDHRKKMLEWDSAHDCFDPRAIEEANRYAASIGAEPDARPAPCSKRDLLVFAQVHASPDAFFVVTRGPAAGNVFYFDHETGIDFDQPVADTLAGWIDAIADPDNEHGWLWLGGTE